MVEADFTRPRALNLPKSARFDVVLKTPKDGNLEGGVKNSPLSCAPVSAAIFLILEMYSPFSGMIQLSSVPLQAALAHLGQ
jgi:hypothetical protein